MSGPGRIVVTLRAEGGRVAEARVVSSRPADAGALLVGRAPGEALALVPRLFALCGEAHLFAARAALTGAPPGPASERRVLAEAMASHGWNALLAWPRLLGEAPRAEALVALRGAAEGVGGGDRAALARAEGVLAREVFGDGDLSDPMAWARRTATPAARLLRALLDDGAEGFGATPDSVLEAGPALDTAGEAALARHGGGLLARLTRRLLAFAALPARVAPLLDAEPEPARAFREGAGQGFAETARGPLRHRARVERGAVRAWSVLAPTDVNFAPDGPAARGLLGARADAGLARRAAWHLAALDPCAPALVRVEEHEHA